MEAIPYDSVLTNVLDNTDHRPWPLPDRPWVMRMNWHDLLFLHMPVPVAAIRERIPDELQVDTLDGRAWIGVIPFTMSGVTARFLPAIPGLSAFPELNVRTYVTDGTHPGVWFFSLDAANAFAVHVARRLFDLPYHLADMQSITVEDGIQYRSRRLGSGPPARFSATYRPSGPAYHPEPGTPEAYFTRRYALYTEDDHGRTLRCDVHHNPWKLQDATAEVKTNSMLKPLGIETSSSETCLHYAEQVQAVAWRPVPVR